MDDVFIFRFDVRYMEVDQQGVVFNAWYLTYFDEAMTALLKANGVAYADLTATGIDVQLVHSEIDWRGGLRWGDQAAVAVSCARIGTTSFALDFQVRRAPGTPLGGEVAIVDARTVYVVVSTEDGRPQPVPDLVRKGVGAVRPLRAG